jgi:hypothetical protein
MAAKMKMRMPASSLPELRIPFGAALDCGSYPTLRKFAQVGSGNRIRDFRRGFPS